MENKGHEGVFSAKMARKLTEENSVESIVNTILENVKKRAEQGESDMRVRTYGFGDSTLYANQPNEKQKEVMKKLRDLGYTVGVKTEERQFVDIYLLIKW